MTYVIRLYVSVKANRSLVRRLAASKVIIVGGSHDELDVQVEAKSVALAKRAIAQALGESEMNVRGGSRVLRKFRVMP